MTRTDLRTALGPGGFDGDHSPEDSLEAASDDLVEGGVEPTALAPPGPVGANADRIVKKRLVLIRHGHPHIRWPTKCSFREYAEWMKAYDAVDIHPRSMPPSALRQLVEKAGIVFTSEKLRSVSSALRMVETDRLRRIATLNEVRLPVLPLPFLRLHAATWIVLSRIAHTAGYSAGTETMGAALGRAREAADTIISASEFHPEVAIVGHGVINGLLARAFAERAWACVGSSGAEYWRWEEYVVEGTS